MDKDKKITLVRNCCVKGRPRHAGETLTVDRETYAQLRMANRGVPAASEAARRAIAEVEAAAKKAKSGAGRKTSGKTTS